MRVLAMTTSEGPEKDPVASQIDVACGIILLGVGVTLVTVLLVFFG